LDERKAKEIVDLLTEKLYSHTHSIGRREARDLIGQEMIKFASEKEEKLMWDLFEQYAAAMCLRQRFNIKEYMAEQLCKEITVNGAFLESEAMSHMFQCVSVITQRPELPPNFQVQVQAGQPIPLIPGFPTQFSVQLIKEGWQLNEGGM
jgi:hypothetical protein